MVTGSVFYGLDTIPATPSNSVNHIVKKFDKRFESHPKNRNVKTEERVQT